MSSPTPNMIAVLWPPAKLSPDGWRQRVEDLAIKAEALVGRQMTLDRQAALATEMFGLLWGAVTPETVAMSARAALLVGEPVLAANTVPNQLAEIAARLDALWVAAESEPDALVASVSPPLLQVITDKAAAKVDRPALAPEVQPEPTPEPAAPAPAPAPAPGAQRQLRPAAERMAARPAAPPRPEPERVEAPPLPAHLIPPAPEPKPAPLPRPVSVRRYPAASKPPGWFSGQEVQELFDVCTSTVCKWRNLGRLGEQGTGWQRCGKSYYYNPLAVEQLEAGNIPAGLDDLLAEVQGQ